MKTFYKCLDNSACIDVRSDSNRIVHATCFISFENKGYVRPLEYCFHNFDLTNSKFILFMRTVSNMPLHILLKRCEFEEFSLDPELDFELR